MSVRSWIPAMEERFEALIFWSRWMLAPAYVVLMVCLAVLCIHTFTELYQLISYFNTADIFDETKAILQILTIVDIVLVLNLVLMVLFVGYTTFVSVIHATKREDWPPWINLLDYSGLKLQMLGSIIAIASIKLLRAYVSLSDYGSLLPINTLALGGGQQNIDPERRLMWMVIMYLAFLFGVMFIAVINKLHRHDKTAGEAPSVD